MSNPIPAELYGRHIAFSQPAKIYIGDDGKGSQPCDELSEFLTEAVASFRLLALILGFDPTRDVCESSWSGAETWAEHVAEVIGTSIGDATFNRRSGPDWDYFRAVVPHEISVVRSDILSFSLRSLVTEAGHLSVVPTERGLFVVSRPHDVVNICPRSAVDESCRLMRGLGEHHEPVFLPIENGLVAIGRSHTVFFAADCGRHAHYAARELLRVDRAREQQVLFPEQRFVWAERIDDEAFEELIADLLHSVFSARVRRVSRSRERDGGRDIIAHWQPDPLPMETVMRSDPPWTLRKILVQCKASHRSVGKGDVRDIRDMLDHYHADGFFLVVSSTLATSMTDYLDAARTEGRFWCDWWTRSEIEMHLRRYPEVVRRHRAVVRDSRGAPAPGRSRSAGAP